MSLDIHNEDTSKILTGGNDKNATVFNKDTEQIVAVLKGHTKKVTRVIYHPNEVKLSKCLIFFFLYKNNWFYSISREQILSSELYWQQLTI